MTPRHLFIVNPFSGAGKGRVVARLLNKLLPEHPAFCGDAGEVVLINQIEVPALLEILAHAETVVAVGGDGTVNRLIPHILACEASPALGLIPFGTSNDLARALGISVRDDYSEEQTLRRALDRLIDARDDNLDVFSVDGRPLFCNYFGLGLDAAIVRDFDDARGSQWANLLPPGRATNNLLYLLMGLKNAGFHLDPPIEIVAYESHDESHSITIGSRCRAIIFSNLPIYAGGCPIRPEARKDDGIFEITVIYSAYQFVRLILTRFLPRLRPPRGLGRYRARRAMIHLRSPSPSQIDGERCSEAEGNAPHLEISFRASLRVLVPRQSM